MSTTRRYLTTYERSLCKEKISINQKTGCGHCICFFKYPECHFFLPRMCNSRVALRGCPNPSSFAICNFRSCPGPTSLFAWASGSMLACISISSSWWTMAGIQDLAYAMHCYQFRSIFVPYYRIIARLTVSLVLMSTVEGQQHHNSLAQHSKAWLCVNAADPLCPSAL